MKYHIRVGDTIFSVSKREYKEYYKVLERWKYVKKRDKRRTVSLDQAIEEGRFELMVSSLSTFTEEEGIKNIQISQMLEEISRLKKEDKVLIDLLYHKQLKIREIAKQLNISVGTVVNRRNRLLSALKKN